MQRFQILIILNAGLLFLAWGIGFSMGIKKYDVTLSLDSDQLNPINSKKANFRMDNKSLNKVYTLLYLDSQYGPMCFCKIENEK